MTTRDELVRHLIARGILREGADWEDCYAKPWISFPVFGWKILFFPTWGRWGALPLHDVNHILSGCDTTWKGEFEIAGWELASGGCGWHLLYWLDRISTFVIGLVVTPRSVLRGLSSGRGHRNTFRLPKGRVLEMDFDDLRPYARV